MTTRSRLSLFVAGCLFFAQFATVSLALPQDDTSADQPSQEFFGTVNVNVVNLEVFASDRSGKPVTDLTKDDFQVELDGRPVPITNFYAEVQGAERGKTTKTQAAPSSPTPSAATPPPPLAGAEVPPNQQLHIVLYVDNFNLRPVDRNRVLRALERFVYTYQRPGTQMMLISYDHQLNIMQPFTSDARDIVDAAVKVEKRTGQALDRASERRRAIDDIQKAKQASDAIVAADSYADRLQTELRAPLAAMQQLMEPLSGLPGRKALVYISNGLPKTPGEDLFYLIDERFPHEHVLTQSMVYDMGRTYREIAEAANRAGVTFYTLDAGGLATFDSLSAEEGGSVTGGSFVALDSIHRANFQAPMQSLAEDTGGFSLTNSNNVELPLDQLAQDFSSYYSLGINAPPDGGLRYHKVAVKVRRNGVKLRYRDGFQVVDLNDRLSNSVTAALTLDQTDNPMKATVVFSTVTPQKDGSTLVPIQVRIPIGNLTLIPAEKVLVGRVKVAVQVADADGRLSSPIESQPLQLAIPTADVDKARGQYMTYDVSLAMRTGEQKIAVGVIDLISGDLSFFTTGVDVPGN